MLLLAGVTVLIVAAALLGWTQSPNSSNPSAALETAVAKLEKSQTAEIGMDLTIRAAGSAVTMSGNGATNFKTQATNLTLTYQASAGQSVTEREIVSGPIVYSDLGSVVGLVVPGKSWVAMDLGQSPSASGGGAGGVFSDPAAMVALLRSEGTNVTALGSSSVDGKAVQGYRIDLGSAGFGKVISSDTPPALRAAIRQTRYKSLSYTVYVDGSNNLTRVRAFGAYSFAGVDATVDGTTDFSNYGTSVSAGPPPANEVIPFNEFEKIARQSQAPAST